MDGREHDALLLIATSSGDPLRRDEWDRWYTTEVWPAIAADEAFSATFLLALSAGFSVPGGYTHFGFCEAQGSVGDATRDRVVGAASATLPGALPSGRVHVATYEKLAEYGDTSGRRANGVLVVYCDPLHAAQEQAFNEWYDHHGPLTLGHTAYHAVTRYVAIDPHGWQPKYLALYETEEPDIAAVHRAGLEWWHAQERKPEDEPPLVLWWEEPFERRA